MTYKQIKELSSEFNLAEIFQSFIRAVNNMKKSEVHKHIILIFLISLYFYDELIILELNRFANRRIGKKKPST